MVISGMPSPESVPAWVQEWLSAGVAEWVPPQALLAQQAASTGGAAAPVIWLYQAPWASTGPAALRLNSWISLQRQALRHRAKQPEPWVLVNIEAVNPDLLAEELGIWVADTEDAALSAAGSANTSAGNEHAGSGLAALWAKLFEWSAPQAWDVYEALEAAAWAAPELPQPWVREQLPTPELRSLEALQKQMSDAATMQSRVAELERALQEAQDASRHQLEGALHELERTKALAGANSQQAQEAEAALARAQEQLTQAQLEADALLQQLHQVQEELEQLFLQGKEREVAEAQSRAELQAAAEQARAEGQAAVEQVKAEGRAALESAQAEARAAAERAQQAALQAQAIADQKAAALNEAQQEGELLLLQLHQVQEELEQLFLQGKEREATEAKARAELQAAVEQAKAAGHAAAEQARTEGRAAAEQAKAEGRAAAERAQQSAQQAQALADQRAAALTESQQEGELLLLQLHQVQEELETHFLRGKDLEQQLQGVRARYQRLQKRFPQAVDVDDVAVAAVDASADVPFVIWRMTGLAVAGKVWPELTLRTTLQAEGTGLLLDAPAGSPLAGCMSGPLVLKALTARDAGQLEIFRTIGSQAWQALIAAAAAVDEALSSVGLTTGAPADFDATFWRQALGAPTAPALRALPPVFRHDGVRLKREKVNPDYEHLWLAFEGATFGPQDMTGFEMRLGAAQVRPGGFSQLPKLEFPLKADGKPPFEGWFEESHDDFGPKYELRADLNRQAFDLAVWTKIPKATQSLLLSVVAAIPALLETLQRNGHRLSRPWNDWQQIYQGLMEVIRARLAPPRPTPLPTFPPEPTVQPVTVIKTEGAEPKPTETRPAKSANNKARSRTKAKQ